MLRQKTINDVLSVLDASMFTRHAFDASFNEKNGPLIRIAYAQKPDYAFVARLVDDTAAKAAAGEGPCVFETAEAPGLRLVTAERFRSADFDAVLARIDDWLKRILEEIVLTSGLPERIGLVARSLGGAAGREPPAPSPPTPDFAERIAALAEDVAGIRQQSQENRADLIGLRGEVQDLRARLGLFDRSIP